MHQSDVLNRMRQQVRIWEKEHDNRSVFLGCYCLMTENMLHAIEMNRFDDSEWINRLLQHFADYYFDALTCYEKEDCSEVWRLAHEATTNRNLHVIQHLLLGINAHINYDLVLTLYDLLVDDWSHISESTKRSRLRDHNMVNEIIADTIDSVQDTIIEQKSPAMKMIDVLLGRLDEFLLSALISHWREDVWKKAIELINATQNEQWKFRQSLEKEVVRTGKKILLTL
jgi:hypothetical protein